MKVPVYIVAGGSSSRFGSDKARALVDGAPQIVNLSRAVAVHAASVTVVAGEAGAYQDLGLRTIADVERGLGPLGGLLTALEDVGEEAWLLLLACDWVGVRVEWVADLLEKVSQGIDVICYQTDRYEPLLALYNTACVERVRAAIRRRELAMHRFLAGADVLALPAPDRWREARNMNTPE